MKGKQVRGKRSFVLKIITFIEATEKLFDLIQKRGKDKKFQFHLFPPHF